MTVALQLAPEDQSARLNRFPPIHQARSAPSVPAQSLQPAPVTPKIEIDPPPPARASTWPSDPQPLLKFRVGGLRF